MFKHKSYKNLLHDEIKRNKQLQAEADRQRADIDYIAMMADVELEMPEDEVLEE